MEKVVYFNEKGILEILVYCLVKLFVNESSLIILGTRFLGTSPFV